MDTLSLVSLTTLLILVIAVVFYVIFWPGIKRQRLRAQPFPAQWQSIIDRRLPFVAHLPGQLQEKLQNLIKAFVADKQFIGCAGLEVDDDMRVTIAAQACLLVLNQPSNHYQNLRAILIYPTTFVATRQVRDDLGLVSTQHSVLLGESWDQGKVVLAWDNVEHGVRNLEDGQNVVLHEFAHQLDSESGATNGAPLLRTRGAYKSWAHIFQLEFDRLQFSAQHHHPSLLDTYGATNPAEFFAVATETFFERPREMHHHHRQLYDELTSFYQLDPANWLDT